MAFEKYNTAELKKYNKILLGIMIFGLLVMSIVIGMELFRISNQEESNLIYLVPTVFGPLFVFIPLIFSSMIAIEIKKREKNNS